MPLTQKNLKPILEFQEIKNFLEDFKKNGSSKENFENLFKYLKSLEKKYCFKLITENRTLDEFKDKEEEHEAWCGMIDSLLEKIEDLFQSVPFV